MQKEEQSKYYESTKHGRMEQGCNQDFLKGGSHCVKHYRHSVFAMEYYRLFFLTKGGSRAPQDPPRYALVENQDSGNQNRNRTTKIEDSLR